MPPGMYRRGRLLRNSSRSLTERRKTSGRVLALQRAGRVVKRLDAGMSSNSRVARRAPRPRDRPTRAKPSLLFGLAFLADEGCCKFLRLGGRGCRRRKEPRDDPAAAPTGRVEHRCKGPRLRRSLSLPRSCCGEPHSLARADALARARAHIIPWPRAKAPGSLAGTNSPVTPG